MLRTKLRAAGAGRKNGKACFKNTAVGRSHNRLTRDSRQRILVGCCSPLRSLSSTAGLRAPPARHAVQLRPVPRQVAGAVAVRDHGVVDGVRGRQAGGVRRTRDVGLPALPQLVDPLAVAEEVEELQNRLDEQKDAQPARLRARRVR